MDLWNSTSHDIWLDAEKNYDMRIKPDNEKLESELMSVDIRTLKNMEIEDFFVFLYDKYFVWKYTQKNRLAASRKHLQYYKTHLGELYLIQHNLFSFDPKDTELGLKIAHEIRGLGYAGASGLLSILFPQNFGTVDQFVVSRLKEFEMFKSDKSIQAIKPQCISFKQAVMLEKILINKAEELNTINNTDYWTPRKIDKTLWTLNRV